MGILHRQKEPRLEAGAEAAAVLDRLIGVPFARPCDRAKAELALAEHLRAAGLDPRPVRWIDADDPDEAARDGFLAYWAANYAKGKPDAPGADRTAAHAAIFGTGFRTKGVVGPALKEEKDTDRSVRHAARDAVLGRGFGAFGAGNADRLNVEVVAEATGLDRLMAAARAALEAKGIFQKVGFLPGQSEAKYQQGLVDLKMEVQLGSAAAQALEAANWLARAHVLRIAGAPTEAHERVARVYMPLVGAVEAGLWLCWVTAKEVIAVAVPED